MCSSSLKKVLTQNEAKIAYTRVLHIVFDRASSTHLQPELEEEGIDDVFQLLINLDAPSINNLQYTNRNNKNTITNVRTRDKMLLKCFLSYIGVPHNGGNPIGNDWDPIPQ